MYYESSSDKTCDKFTFFAKFIEPFFHIVCLGFKGSYLYSRIGSRECRAGQEAAPG